MCGRTGLNLNSDIVRCACAYKKKGNNLYEKPKWLEEPDQRYTPSHNIAPTDVSPVMISARKAQEHDERVLKPMMWGMVPPWHKGEPNKHGLSTHNCRLEDVLTSKLYGPALREGRRCVVVAEGFYEWQTTDKTAKTKQPYFIYAPQDENVQIDDPTSWKSSFDEIDGWKGITLLKMAGLYNIRSSSSGALYSYSIITMGSSDSLNWLHHRMPAILDTEELVGKWLDTDNVNSAEALSLLCPERPLSWHPVSTLVNNSRNKNEECNKRITLQKEKKSVLASQSLMSAWLTGNAGKRKSTESETNAKRIKNE